MIFNPHSPIFKRTALFLCATMFFELAVPVRSYALTGGPSAPEVQTFEPVGTTDMVDPFSGDFNYNIPLLDIEGYPINISYHSGITADQEASWVGLGWNINPGAITRNMRGLPDDFNGDVVNRQFRIKDDKTVGVNVGAKMELVGAEAGDLFHASLGLNFGVFNNSYRGVGYEFGLSPSISVGDKTKGSLNANIGYNSQSGANMSTTLGVRTSKEDKNEKTELGAGASVSAGYNSRGGLKSLSFGTNVSKQPMQGYKGSGGMSHDFFSDDRSTSLSFGSQTYSPAISMPMKNVGVVFSGSVGFESIVLHPGVSLTGYYSNNGVATNSLNRGAYGYLNLQNAPGDTSLTDFNREKDEGFTREMSYLSVPQLTFDMFNVAGHGVGGTFRPYRNDVGVIGDDKNTNTSSNTNLGLEVGIGNVLHGGVDLRYTHVNTRGGKWNELGGLQFYNPSQDMQNSGYEAAYFKNSSEMVEGNTEIYNRFDGETPLRLNIEEAGSDIYAMGQLEGENSTVNLPYSAGKNIVTERQPRNAMMSYITAGEKYAAIQTDIKYFNINQKPDVDGHLIAPNTITRNSGKRKNHHITEITVQNPDGSRYVYGIPTYNNTQKETTFGVNDDEPKNCVTGQVHYTKFGNNIVPGGGSEFLNQTTTPGYAYSYLLTGVLSDDYVDVTGDGITDDDRGTPVKFNYSLINSAYKWRVPFKANYASYNAGHYSDIYDDKGSLVYGEKELWQLHSIETKNYVALFKISPRDDGYGVNGMHGGLSTSSKMYKLDSIVLFAKFNGKISTTPIKTVVFKYDYSLCYGIDNTNTGQGKLTLKEIIFLNGTSKKGYRNRYRFEYQNNYTYGLKNYDRWGNYTQFTTDTSGCHWFDSLYSYESPYTPQDRALADDYAAAWTLSRIHLPSGGMIDVTYEADDYAYVQDQKAGQMFKIAGFGTSNDYSQANSEMYTPNDAPKEYMFFKLQNPTVDSAIGNLDHYFKGIDWLYFNAFVKFFKSEQFDYVRGYLKPTSTYGIATGTGGNQYGYVKIQMVPLEDEGSERQAHPISKAALQFLRLDMPQIVFPASAPNAGTKDEITGTVGAIEEAKIMLKGFNTYCLKLGDPDPNVGAAKKVKLSKSFIRLNTPYGHKLGGGSRVKKIEFFDNWQDMSGRTGSDTITQGWLYSYDLPTEKNPDGTAISSGVASWEPEIGGDENSWKKPIFYTVKNKMALDNEFFQETPYGESQMPSPVVGYSYVTITQLSPDEVGVRGTGYTVHEFYTQRDFPVKISSTTTDKLDNINSAGNLIRQFLGIGFNEYVGASQGYTIELNDMHGKPKAKKIYKVGAENKAELVSGTEYEYLTETNNPTKLSNTVDAFKPDGTKTTKQLGVDVDVTVDMREQITENNSFTLGVGLDNSVVGPIPLIIPHAWPMPVNETSTFKSAVTAKVIRRNAILKKTTAIKEGSYIATSNLVWDSETGEVLMTATPNEFGDTLFSVTYPAHWYVDSALINPSTNLPYLTGQLDGNERMRQSYLNTSAHTDVINSKLFVPGDEVWVSNGATSKKVWVKQGDGAFVLIEDDGDTYLPISGDKFLIYRSGYRNKPSMPIFQVTSQKAPLVNSSATYKLSPSHSHGILNASATQYSDAWNGVSPTIDSFVCDSPTYRARELKNLFQWLVEQDTLCRSAVDSMVIYDSSNLSIGPSWYRPGDSLFDDVRHGFPLVNKHYIKWTSIGTGGGYTLSFYPYPACSLATRTYWTTLGGFDGGSFFNCDDVVEITGVRGKYDEAVNATLFALDSLGNPHCLTIGNDGAGLSWCNSNPKYKKGAKRNKFYLGDLGGYRKSKEFYFPQERVYRVPVKVRSDGTYNNTNYSFSPFYYFNNGVLKKNETNWVTKTTVTHYAPNGQELENKDVLGNYSAALFAFNKSMPTAVAQNSRYLQLGVYTADADDDKTLPGANRSSWKFIKMNGSLPTLSTTVSHSGVNSIQLSAGDSVHAIVRTYPTGTYEGTAIPERYQNDAFYPTAGMYIVSGWVKVDTTANADSYTRPHIKLFSYELESVETIYPSGPIVDGWQRIYGEVEIKPCITPYYFRLIADSSFATWFDDIRIHPTEALMKTFVYDPVTLRLTATLDENNYATFYEYDVEGNLIRLKQETERGIMTVKENRQNTKIWGN